MASSREVSSVQALRAIACMMVVFYHAVQAGAGERAIVAWPNLSAGVDLFFVISGYVMVASSRSLPAGPAGAAIFWRRRILRIVPLYWTMTGLKLALAAAAPSLAAHTRPNLWNIVASLLFIPSRDAAGLIRPVLPIGWTLQFEMLFYLLFGTALALRLRPQFWLWPVLILLALAGGFRTADWPAPASLANSLVLEFGAGMALAAWPRRAASAQGLAILIAACVLLLMSPSGGAWRGVMWGVPAALIVWIMTGREQDWGRRFPRPIIMTGDASYAIYLVHPFVIAALARWGALGCMASAAVSIGAGFAVDRWVDRPLRRAASRLWRPRQDRPPAAAPAHLIATPT